MENRTIGCAERRRQRVAEAAICHRCGRRPDCQGCMEYVAFVEGIEDKNYNHQYIEHMDKAECVRHMLAQVRADLEREMSEYSPDHPTKIIQLANTLFEAAAVITAMGQQSESVHEDDKARLSALNQHSWDGMAMINGYADDDESVTQASHTSMDSETTP